MPKEPVLFHLDKSKIEPQEKPPRSDGKCQYCGGETDMGYGLAGGGMGPYTYCSSCGKICDKMEDPTP